MSFSLSNLFRRHRTTDASPSAGATPAAAIARPGEAKTGKDGIPVALTQARDAQRAAHQNADGSPKLTRYDGREMDFGATSRAALPAGSFGAELRRMKNSRDAGNATVVADNATLHRLGYCYGTHKPMEAWLTDVPKDGKLTVNLILTPSTHAGSSAEDKKKNFEKFAKTNVYNVEVLFPDGTRQAMKFDVKGNTPPQGASETPEYATASPDIEIDLAKWAGKNITLRGWADGSAGVAGYVEHRETILHL